MNKKVVTIQDISCYGQCSITVALPILSALGQETAIIPSAILSTHTSGFKDFTVFDLSNEIPRILNHWKKEGIKFDALYSGYLGKEEHVDLVLQMKEELLNKNGIYFLDPVMGDNGKLYPAFDQKYVNKTRLLVKAADIIVPNLTEACFLSGIPYQEKYDKNYIMKVIDGLKEIGAKTIILTGISYRKGMTGIVLYEDGEYQYYEHEYIDKTFHGTGDVFASTLLGLYLADGDLLKAIKGAAEMVVACIKETIKDDSHWYGVKFETILHNLITKNCGK